MAEVPIELVERKELRRNSVFTIYLDHIRDAAGQEVKDYLAVVPHHRAADGVTGVAVLPVLDGGLGLIRIFRHPLGVHVWEVVRGFVDQSETPPAAALRELREEAGLVTAAASLRDLGMIAPEAGVLDARIRMFAAENCARTGGVHGEMGHREIRYFSQNEVRSLIQRGEVIDPCTLVSCYRYLGDGR